MLVLGLFALLVSAVALVWLHWAAEPGVSLLVALLSLGMTLSLRGAWASLPPFVARWIDGGVIVTTALVAVAATGVSRGLPYAVLRWPEVAALSAMAALAGTSTAGFAYTHRRLAAEVEASVRRLAVLERQALDSRLALLSAQINPHFLFNTLNALAEIVHEDEDVAEQLVTDLAGMMRYALESSTRRVPLSEEIDVVRRLLRIESARLGSRLKWRVTMGEGIGSVLIPGLLVQPLVENAVRHGVAPRPEGGSVEVTAVRSGEDIEVTVRDDGLGLQAEIAASLDAHPLSVPTRGTGAAGGGLRNTALRAALSWPEGRARLIVAPSPAGTCLVLRFPALSPPLSEESP